MATKKTVSKKGASKKSSVKKIVSKKAVSKKIASKKVTSKKTKAKSPILKSILPSEAIDSIPDNVDCMCMQKKPKGKFYNFKLQEGRWVQASAIPFPTKEICEDASC